jgi:hypothetical protein
MFPDDPQDAPAVAPDTSLVQSHTLAGIVRPPPQLEGEPEATTPIEVGHTPDWTHLEVRSPLRLGSRLSFLFPDGRNLEHRLDSMESLSGRSLLTAHPNTWIRLPVPFPTFSMQVVRLSRAGP